MNIESAKAAELAARETFNRLSEEQKAAFYRVYNKNGGEGYLWLRRNGFSMWNDIDLAARYIMFIQSFSG